MSLEQPGSTTSLPGETIKVLLLEDIHKNAVKLFSEQYNHFLEGYEIESYAKALQGEELIEKIKHVHIIGIRSKTQLTKEILEQASSLLAIGCFCIGTNQVDLTAAAELGIPVFNSPYANSRSVAELIIAQIISLARQLGDRNRELHNGNWQKISKNCLEIRGKVLGIIGYGHIGSQLSVLAEALGMTVIFYDIHPVLAMGNSRATRSLDQLLEKSDWVSLHVPATPETKNLMSKERIQKMKPGSFLMNASRGDVVDLDALADSLKCGHLSGAYVDVFPSEPKKNGPGFTTPLQGLPNVLLTPHIGGSTEEAQGAIGSEVARKLIRFVSEGCTMEAQNFPACDVPSKPNVHKILNCHRNVPGVLK
eukprot:Ihof_evm30s3 gene=Ihof_evmTU30s3